jgi:hypothetical protein
VIVAGVVVVPAGVVVLVAVVLDGVAVVVGLSVVADGGGTCLVASESYCCATCIFI